MNVYIEFIFIENLFMNVIIIYATSIFSKVKFNFLRTFLAGTLGAIYVLILYVFKSSLLSSIIFKFILSIVMIYIAFNNKDFFSLLKNVIIFILVTCLFGGVAYSLLYLINPQKVLIKNGIFTGNYPVKIIFLGSIIAFLLAFFSIKIIKSKFLPTNLLYDITICIFEKKCKLKVMLDSGNLLKDPFTGQPVIIVERSILYEILPCELLDNIEDLIIGNMDNIPIDVRKKYNTRIKIIPFSSLGKTNGMIIGIRFDEIFIGDDDKRFKNIVVGIYCKSLTKRGEYNGLIGMDFINKEYNEKF